MIRVFMSRYLPVVAENAVGRDGRLHVLGLPMLPGSLFSDVRRVAGTTDGGGGSPIAPLGSQRRAGAGQDHEGSAERGDVRVEHAHRRG
ncbi:MAG: hypothetical protein WBL53_10585 [Pseudonocardiaceae bacterium]